MSFVDEKIVETKQCKHCSGSFEITDKDLEFYDKVSPVFDGEKYSIPTPTLCPDCRQQRRLSFRNERNLYKRKCSLTEKEVVSIYSPDKDILSYNQNDWWSDKYNPFDYYGRGFDFTKDFFEQFLELKNIVPRITILNGFSDNADYGNHAYHNKNCYFVCSSGYSEDCYYCVSLAQSHDCLDCYKVNDSENCYECVDSNKCFGCQFIRDCHNCSDLLYCDDCEGLKNSLGCKGLKNKQYYILNKKSSKEEYINLLNKIKNNHEVRKQFILQYRKLQNTVGSKGLDIVNSEYISYSDKIENSDNIYHCFECINSRDMKYCSEMMYLNANDCYDYDIWGENASFIYEVHCSGNTKNILFSNNIWGGYNMIYCDSCLNNSRNCFGCVGLKGTEEYCIFNKQYTKEEYNILVPKIINHMKKTGEWGEFFPSYMSPFGYNETVAQEYFPLEKQEALNGYFNWSIYETPPPKVDKVIPASKLPENISDIPDDILNWAIECEKTKKPFKIIPQELEFYRKRNLPIPRRHPDQRHLDRMKLRNPRKLFQRDCDKCGIEIQTTYTPEREETVYCEECYNKEVY